MQTAVLKVAGMTCGGCVKSVSNLLRAIPGVSEAEVSLQKGEARVTFDPARVNMAQLIGAVADAGYQAR